MRYLRCKTRNYRARTEGQHKTRRPHGRRASGYFVVNNLFYLDIVGIVFLTVGLLPLVRLPYKLGRENSR